MKKVLSVLLSVCLLIGCGTVCMPVFAAAKAANVKTFVVIEADGGGTLGGQAQKDVVSAQRDLLQQVDDTADVSVLYTYTSVLNGVAAEVRKGDLDAIRALDGVRAVYEISGVRPVTEPVRAAGDISSAPMIGLETAREMGYDGAGTAIAVIDGGFQVDHAAMRLTDESTAKYSKADIAEVIRTHTMNSDKITADAVYRNAKVPFAFDYCGDDTELVDNDNSAPEHGTHVSGIAAGNSDKLTGVAPEAQVLMFKIDVYADDAFLVNMLAAIDDATKFEIAAMNLSVGMDFEIPSSPAYELLAKAVAAARDAGIMVCTAAGNSGRMSYLVYQPDNGTNGIPNGFSGATSVASVDNIYLSEKIGQLPEAVVYDGGKEVEVLGYSYVAFPDGVELAPMGKYRVSGSLSGKAALVYLQQNDYSRILNAILRSDASAVILCETALESLYWSYNPSDWELLDALAQQFPLVTVSDVDAYRLYHAKDKTVRVRCADGYYAEPAEDLQMSYFSSWGIGEDGGMTVDVAAPGGVIYSSVLGGQYDVLDGTSMATPHITGVAALLEQHLAGRRVSGMNKADLKEALLMSTADPVRTDGVPTSPRVAGAGLVNLSRALTANAVLLGEDNRSALNLGDGLDSAFTFTFAVQNISEKTVRYDTLALDVCADEYQTVREFNEKTGQFETAYYSTGESVPLSFTMRSDMPRSITLQPGEARKVTVTVTVDPAQYDEYAEIFTNGFFIDGYVTLSSSYGEEKATALNAPFLGFAGEWDAVPALEYDEWWGEYVALRSLREVEYIFTDADGKTVGAGKQEYVKKWDVLNISGDDLPDGCYTLTILATPVASDTPQTFTIENYLFDTHAPEIVRMRTKRNLDGSGTITVTMRASDTTAFYIHGGSLLNMYFNDVYPVDAYDYIDEDGNYVYELREDKLPLGWFVVEAMDNSYMTDSRGVYSPLVLLIRGAGDLWDNISWLFELLPLLFGSVD